MTLLDFEQYCKLYVPDYGNAESVGGELIRCINLIFGQFEDGGERLGCSDYAEATLNPAGRYLYRMIDDEKIRATLGKCWGKEALSKLVPYQQRISRLFRESWEWISEHPEVFQQPNEVCFEDELECPLDEKNLTGYNFTSETMAALNKTAGKSRRRK